MELTFEAIEPRVDDTQSGLDLSKLSDQLPVLLRISLGRITRNERSTPLLADDQSLVSQNVESVPDRH
ncbi:hypothetical protein OHS70_25960 [Streptomyces sp. NBC_00390]